MGPERRRPVRRWKRIALAGRMGKRGAGAGWAARAVGTGRMRKGGVAALAAVGLAGLAGCGSDDGSRAELTVVATTPHVGDLVRNVAGERADVETLVGTDADPHDFEPRPSDARDLADADLVVRSGGELDDWLGELIESAGGDARELTLTDAVEERG